MLYCTKIVINKSDPDTPAFNRIALCVEQEFGHIPLCRLPVLSTIKPENLGGEAMSLEQYGYGTYYVALILLAFLLLCPVASHLQRSWKRRKDELDGVLSPKSIRLYYERFFKSKSNVADEVLQVEFDKKFRRFYGRGTYLLPSLVLVVVCLLSLPLGLSLTDKLIAPLKNASGGGDVTAPIVLVSSFMGAYLYVCLNLIRRERSGLLFPMHLYEGSLRLAVSIAVGIALFHIRDVKSIPIVAFVISSFPH